MSTVDPLQYFSDCILRESRVLGFALNEAIRQIRLDVDYAAEAVSHWFEAKRVGVRLEEYQPLPMDFRRFIFFEVSWISMDPKSALSQGHLANGWTQILEFHDRRLPVINDFHVMRSQGIHHARLELNQAGEYRFEFQCDRIEVKRRRGRSLPNGGKDALLEDVEERTVFRFYEPFPHDD